jgi:trimeric autotransporter adhesin
MRRSALFLALITVAHFANAAPWTYRGTLNDGGKPANGEYDLRLTLVNEAGTQSTTQPITLMSVKVKDGNFAADVDFGIDLSQAPAIKLKTEVAQSGSGFMALGEPTRFDAKAALAGVCWDTEGNVGTNPSTNFIGTSDAQAFVIRTRNARSLRIEPSTILSGGAPITTNTIGGSPANAVTTGVRGATIAGGGNPTGDSDPDIFLEGPNSVTDSYGTVGGGHANRAGNDAGSQIDGSHATVGGGAVNVASGAGSTVGGGEGNRASALNSVVSGGFSGDATEGWSSVSGGFQNHAAGYFSTVSGGSSNCAGGEKSWAGGTRAAIRPATGTGASGVCQGVPNSADADGDNGTFVWADDQDFNFISTGERQFLVRAQGGMGINTATLGNAVNLRSSEVVVRNGVTGDNTDITLMNDTNRGYNMVSVPNGANAGTFAIGEVDARTAAVGFTNRLLIAPNGDFTVSAGAFKPGGGAWSVSSDARLKEAVSPLSGSLDRLLQLNGVNFRYRADAPKALSAEGPQIGFIAQEVEQVFPQWIGEKDGYKTVGIRGFEALTVEALRELRGESAVIDASQSDRLEKLEHENALLKNENDSLSARLDAIEAQLNR